MQLPEGISWVVPTEEVDHDELIPHEFYDYWSCTHCELKLEVFLLVNYGRYEGLIRNYKNQSVLWTNKLSKEKKKALKFLLENFNRIVEAHRKGH